MTEEEQKIKEAQASMTLELELAKPSEDCMGILAWIYGIIFGTEVYLSESDMARILDRDS